MSWAIWNKSREETMEKLVLAVPMLRKGGLLGSALERKTEIKQLEDIKYLRY